MQKYFKFKNFSLLLLITFTSCTSTSKGGKQHLTHSEYTQQAPSIVKTPPVQQPVCSNKELINDNKIIEKLIAESSSIETAFLAQNCNYVLEHAKLLQDIYPSNNFSKQPPIIQAAIYTCDAKAGLNDPNRLKLAIENLKALSLRYPLINEVWVHNTLADLYIALNDKQNAINEKKQSRDLLLAQQQDISSLNAEILTLNPADRSALPAPTPTQLNNSPQNLTIDQIISSAIQMINNDSPEQAIALLDTIPPAQRTENIKHLREEAVNNLVTNLRFKVRALFVRSTEQTGQAKKETLQQCEQILKGIIQNYPDYTDMRAVQNNLKQVQRELNKN